MVGSLHKYLAGLVRAMRCMVCSGARGGNRDGTRLRSDRAGFHFSVDAICVFWTACQNVRGDDEQHAMPTANVEVEASLGRVSHGCRDSAVTQPWLTGATHKEALELQMRRVHFLSGAHPMPSPEALEGQNKRNCLI